MCGKPRKLLRLANFAPQVAKDLSQPAVSSTSSPGANACAGGVQKSIRAAPLLTRCVLIARRAPALAPLRALSSPSENQPSAKPPVAIVQLDALAEVTPMTYRNAGAPRSTRHAASPTS